MITTDSWLYPSQNALNAGNDRPTFAFGVVSAILLAGALLPQYYEIWKYKEVKGLSLTFMVVDMAGGVFCILSLAFKAEIDAVATVSRRAECHMQHRLTNTRRCRPTTPAWSSSTRSFSSSR